MFSTCIFCNKPLGANETLETFPVGKRLAFDAARGRLWVVCPACERWNLSPLDERWEAIEQAEKLYRDARRRVTTHNVGLAKLREGTTLVRIGAPQRPEFAAWRYGDQFGRRRTRALLVAGGAAAALGAVVVGGAVAGAGVGSFTWMIAQAGQNIVRGNPETVVAKIRTERHGLVHVRRRHLGETSIDRADDGSLAVNLRFKNGQGRFTGDEAARIASLIVPKVNRFGGSKREIGSAVDAIEAAGGSDAFLADVADNPVAVARRGRQVPWYRRGDNSRYLKSGLFSLSAPTRLALEMALHEEAERRAMEGELQALEAAWREAEEIAAIADNLFVPESVEEKLQALRKRG
ncbi:MAG: hypothetical protein U9Q74_13850 [Gemmatimonadota bacterium]|nr:hypothetical protein [Gemmatimonadota bacterium]